MAVLSVLTARRSVTVFFVLVWHDLSHLVQVESDQTERKKGGKREE